MSDPTNNQTIIVHPSCASSTSVLSRVPIRNVFPVEARLEETVVADLQSSNSKLAVLLDIDVKDVDTQQLNGNMRLDVLINRKDREAEAILELTLEPLDLDHLRRGVIYAIEWGATALAFITPSLDRDMRQLLERYVRSLSISVTIILVNTYSTADGAYVHTFDPTFGSDEDAPLTREEELLRLGQQQLVELGNYSISHVSVQSTGRLELNREGARYLVRAGKRAATLTLGLRDRDGLAAHQAFTPLLKNMTTINTSVSLPVQWGGRSSRSSGTSLSVTVDYGKHIADLTEAELGTVATEVAQAYDQFYNATINYL